MSAVTIDLGGGRVFTGAFNMGYAGLAAGYLSGEIIIPIDYYSAYDSVKSTYTFRWSEELQNLILKKISSWSEPYKAKDDALNNQQVPLEARLPRDFEVKRVKCCVVFSDFGVKEPDYNLLNKSETDLAIEDDLQEIRKYVSSGNYEALFYVELPPNEDRRKSIPPDLIFELSNVVARSDVVSINDYAFYMQKTGSDVLAVMLLEVIYREIPERTVTKLNLADGYWSLGYKAKACRIYGEYVREMNVAGKRNKIPKRAITRTDCLSS
ncbi:hypothetical protein [Ectopseudomonas khazarica]|uniref:hypothetical protein n=1 Tax=Ectopseudomonas khazarica TaxID=2502979 RepID=UPI003B94978C